MLLDKGFFQLARSASKNSKYRYQIGCVIALHGKPVSVGFNVIKTHPVYTANSDRITIHAEIEAVIHACCDLDGGTAWIYREYANGKPALARPCKLCRSVLFEAGVNTVYYTTKYEPYWRMERL